MEEGGSKEEKMEEGDSKEEKMDSPTNSQQTVSDDDEIDYTTKPEFYDPDLDDKDELWVQKKRRVCDSDAVLSCPACFTTLCLECQRHKKYVTRYRAVFVVNCKVENDQVLRKNSSRAIKGRRGTKGIDGGEEHSTNIETFKQVCCSLCLTEVNRRYHFLQL